MKTPIVDFVKMYVENSDTVRMHMPGHKGIGQMIGITSPEKYDITEIPGADSLYEADGIIAESENYASELFGARTFYSTEGSSLCIRAMLYLAMVNRRMGKPWILAGRNAHKTFLSAVALLDLDVEWLYPKEEESYLSCHVTAEDVESVLRKCTHKNMFSDRETEQGGNDYQPGYRNLPCAVYLTSPDYLGNRIDISAIARVCHRYGVLLIVDNAHGAYLRFLPKSEHPIDLGADMCCDSAHKTLPALTGAAYLHIAKHLPEGYAQQAKNAMALFGSTSPSYLILQSLDAMNKYLSESFSADLKNCILYVEELKKELVQAGYRLTGNEPLKITINAKEYGYTGYELAGILSDNHIICEFADPDYLVLMLTPQNTEAELQQLKEVLLNIPRKEINCHGNNPVFCRQERVMSVREAMFSQGEILPIDQCEGRILSVATVGCPPAVPIVICGERINKHAIECFRYYGIGKCWVVCVEQSFRE